MGLGIVVGVLADLAKNDADGAEHTRQEFAEINRVLAANGIPPHREPEAGPGLPWDGETGGGYNSLHHLRFLAAHLWAGKALPANPAKEPTADAILMQCYKTGAPAAPSWSAKLFGRPKPPPFPHLVNHSDDRGYYIPVDFPHPISQNSRGDTIGSTQRLAGELDAVATALGVPANLTYGSKKHWALLSDPKQDGALWERHANATFVLVALREAAKRSMATGAALAFC